MDTKIENDVINEEKTVVKRRPGIVLTVVLSVLFLVGVILTTLVVYFKSTYNVDLSALIYTMDSPLKGTDLGIVNDVLLWCLPPIVILFAAFLTFFLISRAKTKKGWKVVKIICVILACVMFVGSIIYAFFALNFYKFIYSRTHTTEIYEKEYVKPVDSLITADGKTKNLIYIYLESMETTYSSEEAGGRQDVNYIAGLTELASENLTFTDKEDGRLGGFHNPTGTGWTMASILASTSGVPFAFPVERNSMSSRVEFAPGLVTLGDILADNGYVQEFLCGSNAEFGGRKNYFTQHGNYGIFDLFSARENGYIAPDYKVWWGYEDEILYRIAKDEITKLAAGDEPFNFTMLTVDTHHVDGYVCNLCEDEYDSVTANVVSCADRQITSFVEWIKEQDFFEDTVVIISGDHPRMDTNLVESVDYFDRTIFNCIINSDTEVKGETTGRVFTPMDMFPTILEAIGFDVEGDRLGLGTSMFSGRQTLAEEMGYDAFEAEVSKYSPYYVDTFSNKD